MANIRTVAEFVTNQPLSGFPDRQRIFPGTLTEYGYNGYWRMAVNNEPFTAWQAVRSDTSNIQTLVVTGGHNYSYTVKLEVQIGLFKLIPQFPQPGHSVDFSAVRITLQTLWRNQQGNEGWDTHSPFTARRHSDILNTNSTCTTPTHPVYNLGMAFAATDFSGPGNTATTPPVDFQLEIKNCPNWMYGINSRLMVASPSGEIAPADGILPLISPSTAQGVGVKITDQNNNNVTFGVYHPIAYNVQTYTDGNYTVPLRAAFIQTENTIQGGSVHVGLIFLHAVQISTLTCQTAAVCPPTGPPRQACRQ